MEMYPAIIKLYAASRQGDISSWDLLMDDPDISKNVMSADKILPAARSFGHRGEVTTFDGMSLFVSLIWLDRSGALFATVHCPWLLQWMILALS
jgi:hypothetical protein